MKNLCALLLCGALTLSVAHAQQTLTDPTASAVVAAGSESNSAAPAAARVLSRSEYKAQLRVAKETLKANPRDAEALLKRAQAAAALKDYQDAVADYSTLIRMQPTNAGLYFERGMTQLHDDQLARAIADFTKALRLSPTHQASLLYRGVAKMQLLNYKSAITDFSQLIQLDANNAEAYEYRGICYSESNQEKRAMPDLERAAELKPAAAKTLKRYRTDK
ncbi:tetratricopeptide repeat protein [Hymenobacter fastidiosus]|uniref:Tetratricopeptide repeat protein n=1 Tax=Hymenobacter fastidiosus TaxID=486264 RepID=A0ABP7RZ54_9BACT